MPDSTAIATLAASKRAATRPLAGMVGTHPAAVRARIERMEHLLEGLVRVPVLGRRLGLDVILDALPVGGSAVAAAMGGYMLWEARNIGLSRWAMLRMIGNVLFDMALGAIPFIGAVPDFFFRSNTRNLQIIRRQLDRIGA